MLPQNPSSDLSDLTEKQLKFAAWYVAHKLLLRKILISFLIASGVIFWGYSLYGLVNYYFIEGPRFARALKELSQPLDYSVSREAFQPKGLEIGNVSILSAGKDKYDLVAKIVNVNLKWRVEFTYNFSVDGKELVAKKGFLLPGEEKFLLNLGVEAKTKPRRAILEITNLKWQKINAHEIPDYQSWSGERLNFALEEIKFSPAVIRDSIAVSRVTFRAKNLTAYSFWDVGFYILLYRGSSIAGVNYIILEEFISGQVRPVEVSWFESLPSVTQVKVFPEVNIFDQKVYMPVK